MLGTVPYIKMNNSPEAVAEAVAYLLSQGYTFKFNSDKDYHPYLYVSKENKKIWTGNLSTYYHTCNSVEVQFDYSRNIISNTD